MSATNAEKKDDFRQKWDARLELLDLDQECARLIEELRERVRLVEYLENHDDGTPIEELRERVRLVEYLENHDDGTPIEELRERAHVLHHEN
jgi:hypothetical protein